MLPHTAHTSRPWRIHEVAPDFRLEDVWALPTPGGPDDFPRLVALIASGRLSQGSSRAARTLWSIRWKVGELLGWDAPDAGFGSRVSTLRGRLPADLREAPSGPDKDALLMSAPATTSWARATRASAGPRWSVRFVALTTPTSLASGPRP